MSKMKGNKYCHLNLTQTTAEQISKIKKNRQSYLALNKVFLEQNHNDHDRYKEDEEQADLPLRQMCKRHTEAIHANYVECKLQFEHLNQLLKQKLLHDPTRNDLLPFLQYID